MSIESPQSPEAILSAASRSSLREGHLARLRGLLRLRRQHQHELNEQGLRLLDHAIFAAYCDCRDGDFEEEALKLLHQARFAIPAPPAREASR